MSEGETLFLWKPNKEGTRWIRLSSYEVFDEWEVGLDSLLSDRREALRGEGFCVAWSEEEGYRALGATANAAPEPVEVLQGDLDAYLDERLDLRPTLLGGPPDFVPEDEAFRYEEIHE
tara:strand:+ start:1669 stop:2022 length:354 start_codon:yes stop_codon:yes gene_type:complete